MPTLVPVALTELDVTSGTLTNTPDGWLQVEAALMRAEMFTGNPSGAAAEFVFLGRTADDGDFASGNVKVQFGLKLRAANTCNVLYVMWEFAPTERVRVGTKRNPGQTTHAECENRGYQYHAEWSPGAGTFPSAADGLPHTLAASVTPADGGVRVVVRADRFTAPAVVVPADRLEAEGPCGVRSDTARLRFRLSREAEGPANK